MKKLFNRNFDVNFFEKDQNTLNLKVYMKDSYHDFVLNMDIDTKEHMIIWTELELKKKPKEECLELKNLVKEMVGARIGAGFTKTVTSTLGGSKGCPNLVNLFLISAPLALNVTATAYKQDKNITEEEMHELLSEILAGVCLGYPKK